MLFILEIVSKNCEQTTIETIAFWDVVMDNNLSTSYRHFFETGVLINKMTL